MNGPIAASSPSFRIDTAANVYATPLAHSLSYYQNERDGPDFITSPLRTAAAHVNDQSAKVYLTPNYNAGSGRFSGDLTPTGASDRCVRRLVGRRRLSQIRADQQLHGSADGHRSARFPEPDGARFKRGELHG